MGMLVRFRTEAREDLRGAYRWYEERRAGLGHEFMVSVGETLDRIEILPESGRAVHRDVRMALVRCFPYLVFYVIRNETIWVIAVMHASRDPAVWQSRA